MYAIIHLKVGDKMSKSKRFKDDSDSIKDMIEFQKNALNPGYYIGTGKVPPTISAPGNATPLAILLFVFSALFLAFGLFLFFSDGNVHSSGLIESPLANRLLALIIMLGIASFFLLLGFAYLRKARQYRRAKAARKKKLSKKRKR